MFLHDFKAALLKVIVMSSSNPRDRHLCVCADVFVKRRRTALWCSVSLFGLSVLILVVGLLAATQTDNVAVSGYYPGIIVSEEETSHYFNELCFVLSFVQ